MKIKILSLSLAFCIALLLPAVAMANGNVNMGVSLDGDFDKSGNNYSASSSDNYLNDSWYTSDTNFDLHIGNWGDDGNVILLLAVPDNPNSSGDFTSIVLTHGNVSTTINSTDTVWYQGTTLIDNGNSSDEVVNGHGIWYDNYYTMYDVGWMNAGQNLDNPGLLEIINVQINGPAADLQVHFDVFNSDTPLSYNPDTGFGYGNVLGVNASSTDTSYVNVPEPASVLLMLPGLMALYGQRKRFTK